MTSSMKYRIDFLDGSRKEIEIEGTMQQIFEKVREINATLKNVAYTEEIW